MKEKKRVYLPILEFVFYSFFLFFLMMCFQMSYLSFILRCFVALFLFFCSFIYLSIDLFLFLGMKNKMKIISIFYFMLSVFAVFCLIKQPFYISFSFLLISHFLRDILLIFLGEKIYDKKLFERYYKIFVQAFHAYKKEITLLRGLKNHFSFQRKRRVVREKRQGAVS